MKITQATNSAAIEQQAHEHGERAGGIAGEVEGVGAKGGTVVSLGGAEGDDDPGDVDAQRDPNHREQVPAGVQIAAALHEARDRLEGDDAAADEDDSGLTESGDVLGPPVSVVMLAVRGAARAAGRAA